MATFTVRPEGIIRQPALTMPGNATGSEAACTALTGSQIRAICGLGTTDNVTFNTVTATTSVLTPLLNNTNAAALILGNATYGVTVPGQMLVNEGQKLGWRYASGDVGPYQYLMANGAANSGEIGVYNGVSSSASNTVLRVYKYSGGYTAAVDFKNNGNVLIGTTTDDGTSKLQVAGAATFSGDVTCGVLYSVNGASQTTLQHNGTLGILNTTAGVLRLQTAQAATGFEFRPKSGSIEQYTPGANASYYLWNSEQTKYLGLTHDGTNGILSTSSGNINLVPGGGTVAVTGGITASDLVTIDGPTGASGGVTSLSITDGANATFRLSFENANRIMLSGNEGAHNLSFGGKSGNSGTSPFTERFRVDNVANQVVSYSPFICTSITASGVVSHGTYTVATLPAAGSNAGKMAQVTDSNVAASGNYGATVAAGGANRVKVFSDGTNWVIA